MLRSIRRLKKSNQARRFNVLAFFISIALSFLSGCSFDDDTGEYTPAIAKEYQRARVIKVKDGDSVMLRFEDTTEKEARLFGIDAPEYNQPFGRDAKRVLEKLVLKKSVRVKIHDTDRYQRDVVSLVRSKDALDINLELIRLGVAWVYTGYQDDPNWQEAEKLARQHKSGLWALPRPIAPWEWRSKAKSK